MGKSQTSFSANAPLYILICFVCIVFTIGGGARDDIESLIILRPIAALALTYAAIVVVPGQIKTYSGLWWFAAAGTAMVALHLVPLPPSVWTALPNRELSQAAGNAVGLDQPWRPISLVPYRTFNSLFALLVPLAGLALMTVLKPAQQYRLLVVVILIGIVSAILGMLQLVGPPKGAFYLYRITSDGYGVGLFSNRNHHSMFLACCIPLLAAYAASRSRASAGHSTGMDRLTKIGAIFCGIFFFLLILVNGSRSGLIMAVLGLASVPLIMGYGSAIKRRKINRRLIAAVGGVGALLIVTFTWFSRNESWVRLANMGGDEELRLKVWPPILDTALDYFPVGSGFGTFVEVYKVAEPDELLSPVYLNHAHNDWLEVLLTGGLPAMLFLAACVAGWIFAVRKIFANGGESKTGKLYARLGAVITFLLVVGSLVDYPLRTPSLSLFFVISAAWMYGGMRQSRIRASAAAEEHGR